MVKKIIRARADIIVILLAIITITITVLTGRYINILDGDNGAQTYSIFSAVAKAFASGELPLWNPYLWGGFSGVGHYITQAFYPINWLLCTIFYDSNTELLSYFIIPTNIIIHLNILFLGVYFLGKNLGFGVKNATIVAFSTVFCSSIMNTSTLTWIVYFNGFCWFPLLLLFSKKLFENKKVNMIACIKSGLIFGIIGLGSVSLILVISSAFFGILFLFYLYKNIKNVGAMVLNSLITAALSICFCAVTLLPTMTFSSHNMRYVPDVGGYVDGMAQLPYENFVGHACNIDNLTDLLRGAESSGWLSVSIVVIIFAILGFCAKNKTSFQYFVLFSGIFTLCYALKIVVTDIWYYIPFVNLLREPYMYGIFMAFFLCLSAGYGLCRVDDIWSEDGGKIRDYFYNPMCISVILLFLIISNLMPHNISSPRQYLLYGFLIIYFVIMILHVRGKLINKFTSGKMVSSFLLISIVLFEFINFYKCFDSGRYNAAEATKEISNKNENMSEIFNDIYDEYSSFRVTQWIGNSYTPNAASVIGFFDALGYLNPTFDKAVMIHQNIDISKRCQLQNIRYLFHEVVEDDSFTLWYPDFKFAKNVFMYNGYDTEQQHEISVFETNSDLGSAWFVDKYKVYDNSTDVQELITNMNDPVNNFEKMAFVNNETLPFGIEDMNLDIQGSLINNVKYNNNSVKYEVSLSNAAILVTSDFHYPGWRVYVDGNRSTILEVNYASRGVLLQEGSHEVIFKYVPMEFYIGLLLEFFGFGILVFCIIRSVSIKCRRNKI